MIEMRLALVMLAFACSSNGDDGVTDTGVNGKDAAPTMDADVIDPGELDDEFDDPGSLDDWTLLDSSLHEVLEIAGGRLTIVPRPNAAWFEDDKGPFLFKEIGGNFAVHTFVIAGNTSDPDAAPTFEFNSAGFVARDPASRIGGSENWLMLNVGFQDGRIGSEGKTTVDSRSTLFITDGSHRAELILCRVGARFLMLRKNEGESSFTETDRFDRPDMPTDLQVGVVANGYGSSPNLRAVFDYVRFKTPESESDCD